METNQPDTTQPTEGATAPVVAPAAPVAERKPYQKFHPTDIKNLPVEDAKKMADENRMYIRPLKEDDTEFAESRDYDTERINVYITKGVISRVLGNW